jgi:hypothetical protein
MLHGVIIIVIIIITPTSPEDLFPRCISSFQIWQYQICLGWFKKVEWLYHNHIKGVLIALRSEIYDWQQ